MIGAIDGDALYQLVVLVLLGGGSLVKSLLEKKRKREGVEGAGRPGRAQSRRRLAEMEEEEAQGRAPARDPWQELLEGGDPRRVEASAALKEEQPVKEPVRSAAAATLEVSIEDEGFGDPHLEGDSFDQGMPTDADWDPGGRIRAAVEEDIEEKVSRDISEHVAADMAGGVRGDAGAAAKVLHKTIRARRGWRDAVIAAELLGAPVALRDASSQPPGLRCG